MQPFRFVGYLCVRKFGYINKIHKNMYGGFKKIIIYSFLISPLLFSCKTESGSEKEATEDNTTDVQETSVPARIVLDDTEISPDTLKYCLHDEGVGAGGFDVVNYFTSNSALKGKEDISAVYQGVEYHFLTEDNREAFKQDPEHYLPAYGGWCAMTLSMGRATTPVYENFLISNDKLFLFERTVSVNGRTLWLQDTALNSQLADKHYADYIDDGVIVPEEE